jgi:hypothetical protein
MDFPKIPLVTSFLTLFFITGCTSVDRKLSSPNSVVIESDFLLGSKNNVNYYAQQHCGRYGATPVLREIKRGGAFGSSESGRGNNSLYYFDCIRQPEVTKQVVPQVTLPTMPIKPAEADLSDAKKKCSDLGFKSGTEGFGKCVLQLSK